MKKINVLTLILLVGIISCKKEIAPDTLSNPSTPKAIGFDEKNISLVNNRLVFIDEASFVSYMKWAHENQSFPEKIKNVIAQKGLKSLMDVYETGMKLNKETEEFNNFCKAHPTVFNALEFENSLIYELQGPAILAYIANENGIYQVGTKIHRNTMSHSYTINDGDESKIPMLLLPVENITEPAIQVTSNSSKRAEYSFKTANFDATHRIVARLNEHSYSSPQEAWWYEARTTAQKKGWTGVWTQENISSLGVGWPSGYVTAMNGITYIVNAQTTYTYGGSDAVQSTQPMPKKANFSLSSLFASHNGLRNGVHVSITENDLWP